MPRLNRHRKNEDKSLAKPKKSKKKELTSEEIAYYDEAENAYEEPVGITITSLRRSNIFMILSIVFLTLAIAAVCLYQFVYNSGITNRQIACWNNQQAVEELANKYAETNGFGSLPAYVEDIPNYPTVVQECASGGSYTWNPITGEFFCSEHGHYPNGFRQAQSINRGTTITNVEVD